MKAFFTKVAHLFAVLEHDVASAITTTIHFLDIIFTGTEIAAAVTYVGEGALVYVNSKFESVQTREYAANKLVTVLGMDPTRAYALVANVMTIAEQKVDGLMESLVAHYTGVTIPQPTVSVTTTVTPSAAPTA